MSGLEREVGASAKVTTSNVLGKMIRNIGGSVKSSQGGTSKNDLVAKAMDHQHEMEMLHERLGHQATTTKGYSSDPNVMEVTHTVGDISTTVKKRRAPEAKETESKDEVESEIPKGAITRHVKDMLALKANKKAKPEDHQKVAINYGKLIGRHGQKAVDRAIKNHPLMSTGK